VDLSDIYSKQVKKSPVSMLQVGGHFPQIEKDPNIQKLEQDVYAKMRSLMPKEDPIQKPKNTVVPLTFAQALKELSEIQKK
jgi:hypothetical protein